MTNTVLVVDDEQVLADAMGEYLRRFGYAVSVSSTGEDGLKAIDREPPDIVVLDYRLPRMDGLEVLRRIKASRPEIEVILLTAHGTVENAVEAMRVGAFDYLSKPLDLEELRLVVGKALHSVRQSQELDYLRSRVDPENPSREIVGGSEKILAVKKLIQQIAAIEAISGKESPAILLTGETGTGKELVARGIHRTSVRAEAAFVPVNCAAIPESMLERELFGHRRGAFTGAVQDQRGLLEAADGGTILFDEIGEMPLAMQAKLLRVLQDGEVTPLGDTRPRRVDLRVISATNRDLAAEVEAGRFRSDLYYRIAAFPIHVPPLRQRREDVSLLVPHLLVASSERHHKPLAGIHAEALAALERYSWPGNVRELQNEIERAVALATAGGEIELRHLSRRIAGTASAPVAPAPVAAGVSLREARAAFEADYIREALRRADGNLSQAARDLGLSRAMMQRKVRDYAIR